MAINEKESKEVEQNFCLKNRRKFSHQLIHRKECLFVVYWFPTFLICNVRGVMHKIVKFWKIHVLQNRGGGGWTKRYESIGNAFGFFDRYIPAPSKLLLSPWKLGFEEILMSASAGEETSMKRSGVTRAHRFSDLATSFLESHGIFWFLQNFNCSFSNFRQYYNCNVLPNSLLLIK